MFQGDPDDPRRYDDMLDLPHHVSPTRRRMTNLERAAQFAPFAALTGFGEAIEETARLTIRQQEPGEAEQLELDRRLRVVQDRVGERPLLSITYFVPDAYKAGGRYDTVTARVRRLLPVEFALLLEDGRAIDIDNIVDIQGEIFDGITF